MNKVYKANVDRFNGLVIRERILLALTILVVLGLSWWHFFAGPITAQLDSLATENNQLKAEISSTRSSADLINARLKAGVNNEKEAQLDRLAQALMKVDEQIQMKATELIDPEKMFQLMTRLIYKESALKLTSLKRLEVRTAIEEKEGQENSEGIYRHLMEVRFSGKYEDIFAYMSSLEALDWKLIWEEIEISSDEYPVVNVKVIISTLSTRKEWVGV